MIENENPIQECLLSESVSQVIRHVHCYHMVLKDHLGRPYKLRQYLGLPCIFQLSQYESIANCLYEIFLYINWKKLIKISTHFFTHVFFLNSRNWVKNTHWTVILRIGYLIYVNISVFKAGLGKKTMTYLIATVPHIYDFVIFISITFIIVFPTMFSYCSSKNLLWYSNFTDVLPTISRKTSY